MNPAVTLLVLNKHLERTVPYMGHVELGVVAAVARAIADRAEDEARQREIMRTAPDWRSVLPTPTALAPKRSGRRGWRRSP